MTDQDRGAYTPPTDAPLSFDARQPVRGARPMPTTLIVSAVVLVALVAAIAMFYRSGVRQAGQPPQTVGAPLGEFKTPAPADAQPTDPAAGLQVYRAEDAAATPAQPSFTPPPEQPAPRPAPADLRPPIPAPSAPVTQAEAPPAAPAPAPKAQAAAPEPKPTPAAPAPKPAATAAASGAAAVQIGAFSSQALADKGWEDAARIAPGAVAGKGKSVERIERNGATLFRTAVTGFESRAAAAAFCEQLKAAGKNCFVR